MIDVKFMGKCYRKRLKQMTIGFVTLMLMLTIFSNISIAEENPVVDKIETTYFFEKPTISTITIDEVTYDRIIMKDMVNDGEIGSPNLPIYDVRLLLPMGSTLDSVEVNPGNVISLGSGYNIEPVKQPVKLSSSTKISNPIKNSPNQKQDLVSDIETYDFRGYTILFLNINPVKYDIQTGELSYYKNIKIVVNLKAGNNPHPLFRDKTNDEIEVAKKIQNPSAIFSYKQERSTTVASNEYDLLIITTKDLKNHFFPLKNAHDKNGIQTKIVTLNDIVLFPKYITPEKIRDFIRKEYKNYGIEYVLIGGDHDIVPSKILWVKSWSGGGETYMPSDLYYACLDGTYNYDEDDRWGEQGDGPKGEDVDLLAEVYVGRAPVGSQTEVDNFVAKTLTQMNIDYSSGLALFVGEYLWPDPDTWGGNYMDELIDKCTNRYTTYGIPSDQYTIEKLYDRDAPENSWPTEQVINKINSDAIIVNHLGHSYYGYNMKMINDDVFLLSNNPPCFIYSQGCMAGGFDNPDGYDCIGEYFTVKTDKAAFAGIWNARYGWGVPGSTDGPNQRYHRQFLDAIYREEIPQIGKANQDSKEDLVKIINRACMRWCYYELNLFGDPTLSIYETSNLEPTTPKKPNGREVGKVYSKYRFSTVSYDVNDDLLYYRYDWGDGSMSEWLGPYISGEEIDSEHYWNKTGIYKVRVKARDEHRAETDWSEPAIIVIAPRRSRISEFTLNFPILKSLFNLILNR
jgi:hypothetical protein